MLKKLTKAQLNQKVLYFAYGSNIMQSRLEERVGKVTRVGVYSLQDYKLVFNCGTKTMAFANIVPAEGLVAEGIIYEMTYRQLRWLDNFEMCYKRTHILHEDRKLHFYEGICNTKAHMSWEYFDILLGGAFYNKLDVVMTALTEEWEKMKG